MRRIAATLTGVAIAAGSYLLLIDTLSPPELYAGCGVVLLAAIAFAASSEQGFAAAAIDPRWLIRGWRVAVRVPTQIGLVSIEALAQVARRQQRRGSFRTVPFDGGSGLPRDAGRRAMAEGLGSLTPNTIVIGIDPDRNLLLVHQLHRQGGREELDMLELG